ncbi:MAG: helix-turn-helix transcriptional regulator [Ketobacter sp.]|nr:helix-turn-helix transcriptional regulator [Ketobacter sp.]MEC8811475.1 AraC family transcriptional regulator [Pseudomonadota bacterium]
MPLPSIKAQTAVDFEGVVYYRTRSILLLAPSLVIGPGDKTHKRNSIRLLLGGRGPVQLDFENADAVSGRALLVAADSGLCSIDGPLADVALLDYAPASAEYAALDNYLGGRSVVQLDAELFADLLPQCRAGQDGSMSCDQVLTLLQTAVFRITGTEITPLEYDPRIVKALQMIEELPLADISLEVLSKAVNLSPDRFRHLFKETTACTVSQYARQTALWRALNLITQQDYTITAASHALGFHDVSHFYRVYSDMFGISLSERSNPRKFKRVRCFS